MKIKILIGFVLLLFLSFNPPYVLSVEEVVIGQDTVFTTGDRVEYQGDAFSDGTNAYARVMGDYFSSSISEAKSGLEFQIIGYEDGPTSYLALLSFEFEYSINVNYSGGGSADAHINANFYGLQPDQLHDEFYDRINFVYNPGSDQVGDIIILQTVEPVYVNIDKWGGRLAPPVIVLPNEFTE
ncbi:MAG: hypothetical protein K8S13_12770 [Desulfobacula sp.]|uniref:hypothetical protein n=1 Tax=Desulfobacula sp. TaxID=2593537 RepID=UPI0025B91289|nr:hypothetical protein [Desulfobacula sp.]MCD4720711.1 hypothetical protein [Desulfobacula sp.]